MLVIGGCGMQCVAGPAGAMCLPTRPTSTTLPTPSSSPWQCIFFYNVLGSLPSAPSLSNYSPPNPIPFPMQCIFALHLFSQFVCIPPTCLPTILFLNTTFKEQVCPTSFPVPHYNLSFLVKGIQKSVQSPVRGKETISWLVLPLQQQLLDKEHSFSKNCPPSFLLQKIIFSGKSFLEQIFLFPESRSVLPAELILKLRVSQPETFIWSNLCPCICVCT